MRQWFGWDEAQTHSRKLESSESTPTFSLSSPHPKPDTSGLQLPSLGLRWDHWVTPNQLSWFQEILLDWFQEAFGLVPGERSGVFA